MARVIQSQDEIWVQESLIKYGFHTIRNIVDPPDLIVNGNIAVEVRRLNQHYFSNNTPIEVETGYKSIKRICQDIINSFPNPSQLPSAMISYTFFRPLLTTKENRKIIREILAEHLPVIEQSKEYVRNKLEIRMYPWSEPMENRYFIGAIHDGNRGGFVQGMMAENFPIALGSKEKDLPRYKNKFTECWLALIDEIYLWHDDASLIEMIETLNIKTNFDKILIFSPFKHFAFTTLYVKPENL